MYFKLTVIFIFILKVYSAEAQSTSNYYSYFQDYFLETVQTNENTFEQGDLTHAIRNYKIWGPRLYPSGDFKTASISNYNYTVDFNSNRLGVSQKSEAIESAIWKQLGPVGNTTNTPTVGQLHRITFHPKYDGNKNKQMYASSGFGGLWKSNDGGEQWSLMNTDNSLPFCGVADVAVADDGTVFLATGYPDGTIYGTIQPNISSVNPLFTQGVYRSTNDGATWEAMNKNLLKRFINGGVIRRIVSNSENPKNLVLVSSQGIFYCTNATSPDPVWEQGLINDKIIDDAQLRGIEYKPLNSNVVYASGKNIYRSVDGGKKWIVVTGASRGLDFSMLMNKYNYFEVERINIAVTKLNPDLLYAYIMGTERTTKKTRMFLYRFFRNKWSLVTTHLTKNNFDLYSQSYMAITVSPKNENLIYWGNTIIHSTDASNPSPTEVEQLMGYATRGGGYVDIHTLIFEPIQPEKAKLFAANHGGVSTYNFNTSNWKYSNTGICNATIWSFDDNDVDPGDIIIAMQDHGIRSRQNMDGESNWRMLNTGGDGYSARIYDDINKKAYHSNTWRAIYDYDFITHKINNISYGFPKDIPDPGSKPAVFFTNSFPCELDPNTMEPYLGFSEIYKKTGRDPITKLYWQVESDIGKTIQAKWQRQICELAISASNPKVIYLSTMGVDNGTNPAAQWHLNPRVFKSVTGFTGGDWQKDAFMEINLTAPNSGIRSISGNVLLPPVTGIAIHPEHAYVVWITFTGFSKEHKVYRSDDGGTTWINEDPGNKLNNLPVNGIVFQNGTNNRLYIATDAGVYTKDADSDWKEYGDLPNVRVVELKINYCDGTLKAATFGRGVFEVPLLKQSKAYSDLLINQYVVWDTDRYIKNNICVDRGGTLVIKNTLMMPTAGKITVKKGGTLIIDGGKVTNNCQENWDGIYLVNKKSKYKNINNGLLEYSSNEVVFFNSKK
jgi:photosystem II stability/assembly factor-like uncharacterized protein